MTFDSSGGVASSNNVYLVDNKENCADDHSHDGIIVANARAAFQLAPMSTESGHELHDAHAKKF